MALRRYLQPKDGLPDPRGPLSSSISSAAITQANQEVSECAKDKGKRGKYKYSEKLRAEIGKYSSYHGVAAASRHFSHQLKKKVSETTVRSIRDSYLMEVKRKRTDDVEDITILPPPPPPPPRNVADHSC